MRHPDDDGAARRDADRIAAEDTIADSARGRRGDYVNALRQADTPFRCFSSIRWATATSDAGRPTACPKPSSYCSTVSSHASCFTFRSSNRPPSRAESYSAGHCAVAGPSIEQLHVVRQRDRQDPLVRRPASGPRGVGQGLVGLPFGRQRQFSQPGIGPICGVLAHALGLQTLEERRVRAFSGLSASPAR